MFIKAQLSSLTASLIDFSTFVLLNELCYVPGQQATMIGSVAGGVFNFTINRRWVFNSTEKSKWSQMAKYILVWCGNFMLNAAGYAVLSKFTHFRPTVIKVIVSVIVGVFYNYFLQKRFVFK